MIVTLHFRPPHEYGGFDEALRGVLGILAEQAGFLRGELARAVDDEHAWLLLTQWATVGAYRRALGAYAFKLHATPLMAYVEDRPSAFEVLAAADAQRPGLRLADSDRAPDADWVGRGRPTDRPSD